jgi:lysyl-tRNA synthetase class 2
MPSTVIRHFRYRPETRELEIEFTSGRCYRYLAVPEETATAMRQAFSKGSYFNRHIRDKFAFRIGTHHAPDPDPAAAGRQ